MARRQSLVDALKGLLEPSEEPTAKEDPLRRAVEEQMPDAPEETRRLVTAVAGLLASLAYADADYSEAERQKVRQELGRMHGLTDSGVDTICRILDTDIAVITSGGDQTWIRDLRALTDYDQRLEVLEVLIELAAADNDLSLAEVSYLRRLTGALGISQIDYTAAQARHREKLSLLRGD